jgi:hypothetical protein
MERGRLFQLNIYFQGIAETRGENINLLLLVEASATVDERQESILIIGDRRVPLQLDELP